MRIILQELIDESQLQCALVFKDLRSGVSFNFRADEQIPSASTIKLFIMAEVFRRINEGRLDLSKPYTITEADRIEETLDCGRAYTLEALLNLMISLSDNIAANLLIDTVGMESVNAFIREMGLSHTILRRKMLDFAARREGKENLTSASDLAELLERLAQGKVIDKHCSKRMMDIMKVFEEKPWMARVLPVDATVAFKGGDLEGIRHEAAIVFTSVGDYIFVMLTWGSENESYQREAIARVSKHVFETFMDQE